MGLMATIASQRSVWRGPFSLKDPALAELFGGGRTTIAGPVVSEITALTCAAFWDGVNQISSDVAKLPLNKHRRLERGGSDIMVGDPVHRLMRFGPNPETKSITFRKTLTAHALIYGNGYAEIQRDGIGRPRQLWMIHPSRVRPFYDGERDSTTRAPLRYRIDGEVILEPRDVLHIQGLSDDAVHGYNLVGVARETLGLALASQQFASAFFGNGTRFGGVLSSDQDIDTDQANEIRATVEEMHKKADKAFRLLVLGAGLTFTPTGTPPSDADLKDIRDQQVTEVARYLNMPVHKLKLNTPGAVSYNSVEMQDLAYYKGPILDWLAVWEEELNTKLIFRSEWGRQFFKHNNNAFLRGDIKSRYQALGIARDRGVINANEWRGWEDLNPQPGDQGDLYLVQSAQVPVSRLQEIVDQQVAPPPPPAPPPAAPDDDEATRDREALEQAQAELAEARARVEAIQADLADRDSQLSDRDRERQETEAALAEQAEALASLREQYAAEQVRANDAAAEAHAAKVDLEIHHAKLAALEADGQAKADELTARRGEVERLTTLQTNLDIIATFAKDRAETLERDLAAAQEQTEATATIMARRHARTMAAYHDLILDTMQRMVAIEVDGARRKQGTPHKLGQWLHSFPIVHAARCQDALRPIVRISLAWQGRDADPAAVTELIVADHLQELVTRLQPLVDGDPDDFHAALDRVLTRWERDCPLEVTERLMRQD